MLTCTAAERRRAKKLARRAEELVTAYLAAAADKDRQAEAKKLDRSIRRLVRPGYYEHFKSTRDEPKYYHVTEVRRQVNYQTMGHIFQVCYEALYAPHAGDKSLCELLGSDGFLTPIVREEYVGTRFVYRGSTKPRRSLAPA